MDNNWTKLQEKVSPNFDDDIIIQLRACKRQELDKKLGNMTISTAYSTQVQPFTQGGTRLDHNVTLPSTRNDGCSLTSGRSPKV